MARVTPQEYVDTWASRLQGAGTEIKRGIEKVTVAPGQAAMKARELMKARIIEAIDSGLWDKQVGAVSLEDWKQAFLTKGIDRVRGGVDASKGKQLNMAAKLLPAVDQAASKARALPKGTIDQSIARAATFMTEMAKQSGKIRGR